MAQLFLTDEQISAFEELERTTRDKTELAELRRLKERNQLAFYRPYDWQNAFHTAGVENNERMLMAANRVGKTQTAAAETAMHLLGEYPSWWQGHRFEDRILAWTGSPTNETSRDIVQKALLGGLGDDLGTGFIPADRIKDRPQLRTAGIPNVVDQFRVIHKSGGTSQCNLKSYEQGWRKWQGTAPHLVWLDEEAEEEKLFSEAETRTMTSKGKIMVTFTPLLGETFLVTHFMYPKAPGVYLQTATWDDAPHLSENDKENLRALYPDHEMQARTMGLPMMGEGRVFNVSEEAISCEPFDIEQFPWFAYICGVDFGVNHPAAGVWLAHDRDKDIVYLYDSYRQAGETAVYHASAIRSRGEWIPVAWPHDGINREKSGGRKLRDEYAMHGVNMLGKSARYKTPEDRGGGQPVEPIVYDLLERMKTGRFKVMTHNTDWFREFRSSHRKNGKIVANHDDLLKATYYGLMMLRYARTRGTPVLREVSAQGLSARL